MCQDHMWASPFHDLLFFSASVAGVIFLFCFGFGFFFVLLFLVSL